MGLGLLSRCVAWGSFYNLIAHMQTAVCRGGRWTDTAAGSRRHCGRAGVLALKRPAPGQLLGWVLVVRATLARSEAKSRGRRRAASRCEEFAYHALVRLAQIRTSGENCLNLRCVGRPTGPMPGASGRPPPRQRRAQSAGRLQSGQSAVLERRDQRGGGGADHGDDHAYGGDGRAAFRNHLVLAHISSGSSASVALARRKSADTARRSASASAVCSPCL